MIPMGTTGDSSMALPWTIVLTAVAALAVCGHSAIAAERPGVAGDPIDKVLAPRVTPAFQSEVAVLGTLHLSSYRDRLQPGQLEPLLALLQAYGPTRIAVETLSADEIALLAEREVHDSAAAEVIRMFARAPLQMGRSMQGVLAMDRIAAARKAQEILQARSGHLSDDDRLELAAYWLAAYEFSSAALQWSYLPAEVRARATNLPTEVRDQLDRFLSGSNENVVLALVLARRLGLQAIIPIDSQYDGVRTLSAPAEALKELFTDPDRAALLDRDHAARAAGIEADAFEAGDLLPLYRYLNSPGHMSGDATQWHWLFAGRHSSGLDRMRYAMWELRNLRQATNIVDAAASGRPERLLVIVGAAHKAALERVLATQLSVRLVAFDALERSPPAPPSRRSRAASSPPAAKPACAVGELQLPVNGARLRPGSGAGQRITVIPFLLFLRQRRSSCV
jgi:hypothetical protein